MSKKNFDVAFEWTKDRLWLALGKVTGFAVYFGVEPRLKWAWLIVDRKAHLDNLIEMHTR